MLFYIYDNVTISPFTNAIGKIVPYIVWENILHSDGIIIELSTKEESLRNKMSLLRSFYCLFAIPTLLIDHLDDILNCNFVYFFFFAISYFYMKFSHWLLSIRSLYQIYTNINESIIIMYVYIQFIFANDIMIIFIINA